MEPSVRPGDGTCEATLLRRGDDGPLSACQGADA